MPSLFSPKVSDNKANPLFLQVRDSPAYRPCREMMDAIFAGYRDKDRNFIKDFQQTGFSARVWELSLFAFLQESELELDESHGYPDYVITRPHELALEAVTSQPTQGAVVNPKSNALALVPEDVEEGQRELVFRIGNAIQ